jgi:hypothetical protein
MDNAELLEKAQDAINDLFSDMSVSPKQCRENLRELIADIEVKIESLGLED